MKIAVAEGNEFKAKNYVITGCLLCLGISLFIVGTNAPLLRVIPRAFLNNTDFQDVFKSLIAIFLITLWGEMSFAMFSVVFRSLLNRKFIFKSVMIIFYTVSLPISMIFGFGTNWKLMGIWAGRLTGIFLINLVLVGKLTRTDWWLQLRRAHFSLQKHSLDEVLLDMWFIYSYQLSFWKICIVNIFISDIKPV